jgi:hypothetical protein
MRSLVAQVLVPVLATLLVLTTPVGTGEGVHQSELLHPVFPHTHLIDGRIVFNEQIAAAPAAAAAKGVSQPPRGPALGAGGGADTAGFGLALGPVLPMVALSIAAEPRGSLFVADSFPPTDSEIHRWTRLQIRSPELLMRGVPKNIGTPYPTVHSGERNNRFMLPIRHALTRAGTAKFAIASIAAMLDATTSFSIAWAHSYPQTMDPAPNARLDSAPSHVDIIYDSNIAQSGTSLMLLDSTDSPVAV